MVQALGSLKERFGIKRVVIVADRGLNSRLNLLKIKEAGYGYIVAGRIKSMSKDIQKEIQCSEGYDEYTDEEGYLLKIKVMDFTREVADEDKKKHVLSENLILSYSEKRGGKKYLLNEKASDSLWKLDAEQISVDACWDGYYGIQTSEKAMTPQQIRDAYHTLWKIEESFRIMKSTLEKRPIFHWTPNRIRGHFLICFLSFLMERKMEMILGDDEKVSCFSPDKIQEALLSMQLAEVTINGNKFWIKTVNKPLGNQIFKKLKLKVPKNISTDEELISNFQIKKKKAWWQLSLF